MPVVTRDYRRMRLMLSIRTGLKFLNRAIEDLALHLHPFTIARIEMLGQTACLFPVPRVEQIDNGARCVHASSRIDSRTNAKAKVVCVDLRAIATTSNIDQRAQSAVDGFWQVRKSQRNDRAIFTN